MYYVLSIFPLCLVTAWHAYLLCSFKGSSRTETISEHACETKQKLRLHRAVHILASICLFLFGALFLWQHDYHTMALLLMSGAVFDVIEVMTLNEYIAHKPVLFEPHQTSAWAMAFCYLTYGVLATKTAGLSPLLVSTVWVSFFIILGISIKKKFRRFWVSQMTYFTLLSIVLAIAQAKLVLA
jgi:hypothetical protein